MKWIGKRISFVDDKLKTTVVIEPESVFWVNALMGAWVAMWMVIGATVIWALLFLEMTKEEKIGLIVFLSFWLYFAIRVTRTFFWLLWGKELIKIDETAMTYKRSIRRFGKAVPYYLENITKIRVIVPKERSLQSVWEASPWIRGGERLEFDYLSKTVRFGRKLDEKDAKLLYQFLTKKIDQRLRKKA